MVRLAVILPVLLATSSWAAVVPPDGAEVITGSTVADARYELYTGALERNEGRVRGEASVALQGKLTRTTWRVADDMVPESIVAALRDQFPAVSVLFECAGRDCGRSTLWANHAFGVRQLTGLNDEQNYLALVSNASGVQQFAAIYVVRRGNGRLLVHLDQLRSAVPVAAQPGRNALQTLRSRGRVVMTGLSCGPTDACDFASSTAFKKAVELVRSMPQRDIWLVCHSARPTAGRQTAELVRDSHQCAGRLARQLGPRVTGFGVGPLQPLGTGPANGAELVVPALLPGQRSR